MCTGKYKSELYVRLMIGGPLLVELQYGITGGYYYPNKEREAPVFDEKNFYSKCKEIASKIKIRFKILDKLGSRSYYAVKFIYRHENIYVMCHISQPIIAFCSYESFDATDNDCVFHWDKFLDIEELTKEFESEYKVLSVHELNSPFLLEEHEELKNVQSVIEQVEYYNPKTIGEAIFNYWD